MYHYWLPGECELDLLHLECIYLMVQHELPHASEVGRSRATHQLLEIRLVTGTDLPRSPRSRLLSGCLGAGFDFRKSKAK